jgi:cytochrome P450
VIFECRPGFGLIDQLPGSGSAKALSDARTFRHNRLINSDPPDHTRIRATVNDAFSADAMNALRPQVSAIVNDLLDAVDGRAGMDLVSEFGYLPPTTVIARLLGVPLEDRDKFNAWVDDINTFHGNSHSRPPKGIIAQKVC